MSIKMKCKVLLDLGELEIYTTPEEFVVIKTDKVRPTLLKEILIYAGIYRGGIHGWSRGVTIAFSSLEEVLKALKSVMVDESQENP